MLVSIFLVLVLIFLYLSFKEPCSVLILIFSMFALEQLLQANFPIFLKYNQFINIFIGGLVLIALINTQLSKKTKVRTLLLEEVLVYSLFMYSFFSISWSPDPSSGYEQWAKQWPYMVVLLLFAPRLIVNPEVFSKVFFLHALTGGLISMLLLTTVEWQGRKIDIGNQGGNPLATAQMAGYAILAALLYNLKNNKAILLLSVKVLIVIVCGVVALRSGSRGQLISTFIALMIFWPISYRIKNLTSFVFLILLLGVFVFLFEYGLQEFWSESDRFSLENLNTDATGRLHQSFLLMKEWLNNPFALIFGLGNSASYTLLGYYPHNVFFEVIGEEGVIGVVIYVAIVVLVIKNIKILLSVSKHYPSWRKTCAVLSAFALFAFLLSMKQGSLIGNQEFFMMTMIIARYKAVTLSSLKRVKRSALENSTSIAK